MNGLIIPFTFTFQYKSIYAKLYLNKTNYYTGFCIITDCVDYLAILVNSTLDYPMTSYLEENLGINNFEVFLDRTDITAQEIVTVISMSQQKDDLFLKKRPS